MPVTLNGSTSGQVTLTAPAVAGTTTLTLPASTGNVVVDGATQTLTNKTLTSPTINTPIMGGSVITSGTAQASTSGLNIDFTGIPSWAKRVTVMLQGVSTGSGADILVQLGAGSVTSSGYLGATSEITGTTVSTANNTNGFAIATANSSSVLHGSMTICLITGNTWVASGVFARSDGNATTTTGGSIALGGTLDRVRITVDGGGSTFDAGTINIMYE